MKKKIVSACSLVLVLSFLLCACGTDATEVDYNGYSYDDLYSESVSLVESFGSYSLDTLLSNAESIEENKSSYISSGYTEDFVELNIDLYEVWAENVSELGSYTGYEDDFTVDKAGSTVTTDITVLFENGSAKFELVYNYNDMEYPTGVTFNINRSLGEKMSKAGMNTIISISIVFAVLILISLIIYAFNIFPYLENRKKEREKAKQAAEEGEAPIPHTDDQPVIEEIAAQPEDDLELIAVIAAAIASAEGTTPEGFVVRSIRRR